jgi:hypothetical protein
LESFGRVELDSGGIVPPDGKNGRSNGLMVCPFWMLASKFWNVIKENSKDAEWQGGEGESGVKKLEWLTGETQGLMLGNGVW